LKCCKSEVHLAFFFFSFAYTTSPAAVMKLVVFFRSSKPPQSLHGTFSQVKSIQIIGKFKYVHRHKQEKYMYIHFMYSISYINITIPTEKHNSYVNYFTAIVY